MIDSNIIPDTTDYKSLYHVHPGETRHETALRYIRQAKNQNNSPQVAETNP